MLGAQFLVFRSETYEDIEKTVVRLKRAGVNTLIVRAFQNPGDRLYRFARPRSKTGAYFYTVHAPVVDAVLPRIVSIGHRHGLQVFAWLETRKMPLNLPDPNSARALSYDFSAASLKTVPMWSVFDPSFQKALAGLYRDAALTGVDGILIQDDLIMYQHEDFSPRAISLFEEETGKHLDPEALYLEVFQDDTGRYCVSRYSETFWEWVRWKNQKLMALAAQLIASARSVNAEIKIAMNFMYESVTAPKHALAWLSQSLEEATKLPIDYYAIMAYHRQMKEELNLSEEGAFDQVSEMTAALLKRVDNPNSILMKVQLTDWKTRKQIPSHEADQVFERINNQGKVSLAFIPYSPRIPLHVIGSHYQ
jgi:biofilm PGA synthesis lipoprotein PgaB